MNFAVDLRVSDQSVPEFYSGKAVFIIGASGFIGKVLLEKLLYSCPEVGKIFVLIRENEENSAKERLVKILDAPIFDRIKATRPTDLEKLVPVAGDITRPNLGISDDDEKYVKQASVVFHLAATVKFNESLTKALEINVEGTRSVINFCSNMQNVEVFSYLSTIYSSTGDGKSFVEEKLYPPRYTLDEIHQLAADIEQNKTTLSKVLGGYPNTYTLTKSIAEEVVSKEHGDMPTVIVRPSAVTAAEADPLSGWIDTWNGPTPILTLLSKGFTRTMHGYKNWPFEIIPVEYVTNLMIISAAKLKKTKDVRVYHSCSSGSNPIMLQKGSDSFLNEARRNKFGELPSTSLIFVRNLWLLAILTFLLHTVPAFIGDVCLYLQGKPLKYMKLHRKMSIYLNAIQHFSSRCWAMSTLQTEKLHASLNEDDRRTFPCDPRLIRWDTYFSTYFHGVQKYLISTKGKS